MDMFDQAKAMAGTLKLCKITQDELAKQMGVSQSYIANKLRLLGYSDTLAELIRSLGLTERHARAILRIDSEEEREKMIRKVHEMHLSVRECEALVDAAVEAEAPRFIGRAGQLDRITAFSDTLRRSIATLRSLGIDAKAKTSYSKDRMFITVMIGNI